MLGARSRAGAVSLAHLVIGAAAVCFAVAQANIVNDIVDRRVDAIDQPWRLLPGGTISFRPAWVSYVVCCVTTCFLGWLTGPDLGLWAIVMVALSAAYSWRLWSKRPGTFAVMSRTWKFGFLALAVRCGHRTVKRAVVVGSGVSGLAAAWKLTRQGWQVTVLERDQWIGGRCGESPTTAWTSVFDVDHLQRVRSWRSRNSGSLVFAGGYLRGPYLEGAVRSGVEAAAQLG